MGLIRQINIRFVFWIITVAIGIGSFASLSQAKDDLKVQLKSKAKVKTVAHSKIQAHSKKPIRKIASIMKEKKHKALKMRKTEYKKTKRDDPKSLARKVASVNAEFSPTPTSAFVGSGAQRSLEIRGQSRTLSMMLVLRNGKESLNFVRPRVNYHDEIVNTQF